MSEDIKHKRRLRQEPDARYRVELLGRPRFFVRNESGEEEVKLRSRQSTALLAVLYIRNQGFSRDRIVDFLWHENDGETARANLRVLLARLKKLLPGILTTDNQSVSLTPGSLAGDTTKFDELLQKGTASTLTKAALLYQGEFMEGFDLRVSSEFEIWLAGERDQWRERYNTLMRKLVDLFLAQGRGNKAQPYIERWHQIEPESESAYRQHMWLAWKEGNTEPAIAQYRKLVRKLNLELGVGPEASTQDLYERITQSATHQQKSSVVMMVADASEAIVSLEALVSESEVYLRELYESNLELSSFAGRDLELALLTDLIKEHRLVTLYGIGGVGKTRLALEACRTLDGHFGSNVHVVFCEQLIPQAFNEHLDALIATQKGASGSVLVVLDSFDLVGLPYRSLVELLQTLPDASVVVTSREPLGLLGERLFSVLPLPFPQGIDERLPGDLLDNPAVQLFWHRAHLEKLQEGRLREADAERLQLVSYIVRTMSGLPLGIEIAASQLAHITLSELAEHLEQNLHTMSPVHRTTARHESLSKVFSESWHKLGAQQQQHLFDLTQCPDPFSGQMAAKHAHVDTQALRSFVRKGLLLGCPQGRFSLPLFSRRFIAEMARTI